MSVLGAHSDPPTSRITKNTWRLHRLQKRASGSTKKITRSTNAKRQRSCSIFSSSPQIFTNFLPRRHDLVNMADTKSVTDRVGEYKLDKPSLGQDQAALFPPCLLGLSDEELKKLGRKTTFKPDIFVMPAMTIMYILNYLGMYLPGASLGRKS